MHGEQETEWQFAVPRLEAVARLLRDTGVPGYTITPGETRRLRDTYFETPGWHISHAGYTCRLRTTRGSHEATLKTTHESPGGLRQRQEVTEPVAGSEPGDLRSLPGPAGSLLREVAAGEPVTQLFTINTRRDIFHLADHAGFLGEIALDHATIPAPGTNASQHIERLEVEVTALERGTAFVEALGRVTELEPAPMSKFQAALLATGQQNHGRLPH